MNEILKNVQKSQCHMKIPSISGIKKDTDPI